AGFACWNANRQRVACGCCELDNVGPVVLWTVDHDAVSATFRRHTHRQQLLRPILLGFTPQSRRRSLGPLLGLQRCVGQALATEAIAKCVCVMTESRVAKRKL